MEILTAIAAHAIAVSVLAGLALPVLAVRLILAFDKRAARLVLPSAVFTEPRKPMRARNLRLRRLPALAVQYSAAPRTRSAGRNTAPGLAARWKDAHRLAVNA